VQVGWEVVEGVPKSDAGDCTPALAAGTVAALRAHRRRQREDRLRWGSAWTDSGRVFTREDGSALHPATITERIQAAGRHSRRNCRPSGSTTCGTAPRACC
jgi:hypothetical protein